MDWEKILFNSGDLFLPTKVKRFLETYWIGDDSTIFYVTWWTLIHFMSGLIIGQFIKNIYRKDIIKYYLYGFVIHSVWELWQIIGKNTKYWTLRGIMDIFVDSVSFMLGMFIMTRFI